MRSQTGRVVARERTRHRSGRSVTGNSTCPGAQRCLPPGVGLLAGKTEPPRLVGLQLGPFGSIRPSRRMALKGGHPVWASLDSGDQAHHPGAPYVGPPAGGWVQAPRPFEHSDAGASRLVERGAPSGSGRREGFEAGSKVIRVWSTASFPVKRREAGEFLGHRGHDAALTTLPTAGMMDSRLGRPGGRGRQSPRYFGVFRSRKVRAPSGRVPGNSRSGRPGDRATEKNRPGVSWGQGEKVV